MDPARQQRVVGEVQAGHDVRGAESHLLGFGEEVVGVAVEHHAPDDLHWHQLLGDQLGRVEDVEAELLGLFLREDLQAQFPLRVLAGLDCLPQVAAMEVRVGARNLHRLLPHQRVGAELGLPMELDEEGLARVVDEAEGVDAEALHHPVAARDRAVRHLPH